MEKNKISKKKSIKKSNFENRFDGPLGITMKYTRVIFEIVRMNYRGPRAPASPPTKIDKNRSFYKGTLLKTVENPKNHCRCSGESTRTLFGFKFGTD